jgi:hypothetical protein
LNVNQNDFIQRVEQRLRDIFLEYNNGCDVPPARLFRLEGYIEAGRDVGLISQQQACDLICSAWREVLNCELPVCAENTIQIPAVMQRAPVYPSK